MKRKKLMLLLIMLLALSLTACVTGDSSNAGKAGGTPTTVTVWTYYNGAAKDAFDGLVAEFNKTVGKENNIVIDPYSQGDVNQLADAVLAAANQDVGSKPMPHIFSAYSDSAYKIDKLGMVEALDSYFTEKELSSYRSDFLEDGCFGENNALKIIPIAKSSEIIFVNQTDFNTFVSETGSDPNGLATWEGLAKNAERYYNWTDKKTPEPNDGKALFGIDSMANYMLVGAKQLGQEIYNISDSGVIINFPRETAKTLWDNFYVPFVNGHYAAIGRFRSDDAKTGDILAYSGSTAGASYFPKQIETSKDSAYLIECMAFPTPVFEDGTPVAVHQGAGMVVSKSDKEHQNASVLFLKWITDVKPNSAFAVKTGYLPVKSEVLTIDSFYETSKEMFGDDVNPATLVSALATYTMINTYSMFANKPFSASFEARKVLETSLLTFAKKDLGEINSEISLGKSKKAVVAAYVTDKNFDKWYEQFITSLEEATTK